MKRLAIVGVIVVAGLGVYVYRTRSTPQPQRGLPALRASYAGANDTAERIGVLLGAAKVDDPGVAGWLAGIAEHEPALANQASTELGAISNRAAGGELLEIATGSGSTLVRANAVRALGKSGGPEAAAALATTIQDRVQPLRVRQEAALALGTIGDRSVVPSLIATIEAASDTTPDSEQLRISAVQALGALGSPEAHEFLSRYAQGSLSPTERAFVARAASAPTR